MLPAQVAPPTGSFGSVVTAMVTPMRADGSVDRAGLAQLANWLVDQGNDGLVVNGTTGEAPTTTDDEKLEILETVLAAVGDRATVTAGVGTNATAHSCRLARQAANAGAHGLLVVTPYYNRPPQSGVIRHIDTISDATELPLMLYDIPGRTGTALEPETLISVANNPRVRAVKDAKGDLESTVVVLRETDLEWYSGDDGLNLPFLAIGAVGFVSVTGHVVAGRLRELRQAYLDGQVDEARLINESLQPVSTGLFRTQGVILAKAALELLGQPAGPVRSPLVDATPEQRAQLARDLLAGGVDGVSAP